MTQAARRSIATVPSASQVVENEGEQAGHLVVSRPRRGTSDLFRSYKVLVDGEQIGSVKRGRSLSFPVAAGKHEVHLEINWCRSPSLEVEVRPGETSNLVCWPTFQAWRAQTALANPDKWISLTFDTADGSAG